MAKIMCIMSDGFEELEAVGAIALWRRSGIQVDVYALNDSQATGRFDLTIANLRKLECYDISEYDALFLPGGPHYKDLEENDNVQSIIRSFVQADKVVTAICAAPTILGRMGLLKDKQYTCFTSMNEDFHGTYVDQYCVQDGNFITGRSAAAVIDFAFLVIETLLGTTQCIAIKKQIYYDQKD